MAETTTPAENNPQTTEIPSETTTPVETEKAYTTAPQEIQTPTGEPAEEEQEEAADIPGWVLVLIAVFGAGAGVGTAILLVRKNKK